MANFKEKQYTIDDIARIRKGMEENQQRMHEEKAKQTNAAPKYGYKLPTLESKRQERTKANDIQSMQMANDRMVSQKSGTNNQGMPLSVNKFGNAVTNMSMPSPVNRLGDNAPVNIDMENMPSSSLNSIKDKATWSKDSDKRYPKDTWKELSREEIQSLEREARRLQAKGMDASAQEMNRLQEIYEISDNNERNKAIHNKATVDEYINPNRKLSSDEESIAKEIVDNYFNENSKAYKLLHSNNPNFSARIRSQMTKAEIAEYEKMTALLNKTSNLSAFTYGMLNIMPFGNTAMDKMGELMGVDPQYNYSAQERNTKSQNPLAFMGGDMTSKLAAYSVLGNALEEIPALAKATNGIGSTMTGGNKVVGDMIGKVLRGDIADIALDTIPTEIENYQNGMRGRELVGDTLKNLGVNTLFNAGFEAIPYLLKGARGLDNVTESIVPQRSQLEMEREALQSSQNDMDMLSQYLRENPRVEEPTITRPTNLEIEQAMNNRPDDMEVLRQAMAEQEAQIAREQAIREVPRVGETPSLIAKENSDVSDITDTIKEENFKPISFTSKDQTPIRDIDTKEISKIQFANDADRAEFNNIWSEFERANAEFDTALANAEDEADILDAITRIEDTFYNVKNIASKGTITDKSGQNSLRDIKKDFKANTKGMVINLPAEMRNEMGFKDMTMRQINSKMSSLGGNDYIKFSAKGGTPIDEVWDELVRASGNQLSPDVANSADMAASLIDYVDSLKVDGRGIEQIEANINNIIPDEYWDDIARRAEEAQQRLVDEGKVIAEDIGINPNTTFDDGANIIEEEIARNEPYELSFNPSEYENGTEKVSKAYTNTGRNANGWNEAEYNKYTDPSRYTYESKSEIESVNKATAMREEEGREAFKNRVLNAEELTSEEVDGLMMEWRETIQEAREIESNGGDASALWEESNRIFKRVQTESTKNAQALQALAKWSRNTPEGLLMHTENIVNGKVKAPESELQKFLDKFAKKNKDIDFSADFQKNFLEEAEKLQGLDLNSKEAKDIMGRLGRMTNAELPVRLNEKMQSLLMDNMLGNFRTLITRNAGGNIGLNAVEQTAQRPLAAAIDRLVSHKTGIRTQAGMTKEGLQEYISGFKKGLTDEIHDIRTGLHTSRTGENTIENALNANRHVFKNKILDKFDSFVKNGLSVGDRPFYEAVYKQTLGDYNRLRATGQMGDIVNKLSDADFNTYAETAAHLNALMAVYQNDSAMSKALLGFKRSIGQLSEGTVGFDILSQFSMPFVKTPANVVDRAIDYSPLGLVRNIARTTREGGIGGANFDQNRFVNELSRNILGTGLMGGAAMAASNNILTGAYSDDDDEKQLQKQSGMQEYALNIPTLDGKNYNMDIGWLPVVGSNAVAAAAAVDAYRNGEGNVLSNIGSGLVQGGESLFDQSMFQGLQRLFGADNSYNSDTGIVGNALNTVKSGAGQLIPSLARQIAQVSDPYQRDVSNSNGGNYDVNSLINNIPGARQSLLAPKVDANGNLMEESQGRGMGMRFLEDMILPGKITEVTSNELDEEAVRLSDETGSEASFRPKPYRKDIDADKKLTNEEWVAYEQKFNSALTEAGNTVINSDAYKGLNAEAQNNLLSNVYKSVKSAINSEYNGKELSGGAKAYAEAGGGEAGIQAVVDYHTKGAVAKEKGLSNNNATQAIYDADGEQGLDNYAAIKEAGGTKKTYNSFMLYNQRAGSKELPTLDAKQFMSQVDSIEKYNKDGKINGEVSQQELADYLNEQKYNSSKADAYVKAFFGDDYIAYTTKKNRIGIKKKE